MSVDVSNRLTSKTDEHFTPPHIIEAARQTMGGIDIDPACSSRFRSHTGAIETMTKEDDALKQDWHGRAFLNPPGGISLDGGKRESNQKRWWFKLAQEYADARVTEAIFVCFSIELFQTVQVNPPEGLPLPHDFTICFPSRRLAYLTERDGTLFPGMSPPHASAIVFLPRSTLSVARFEKFFSPIGKCIRGRRTK